ncbi:unnamed protein product [Sphenostylis stenocarpa]|uniref:Neprosin PEP catalytic domain-containing protein n=1 Tax=Sphenostylis stenocarpa TaxID=92480 RepID=A0AA86TK63_9FABA|nr:unnamed protein product [Sphenostylis stenocarpa]
MTKMMNTIIFVLCLVIRSVNSAVHGIQITPEEDLELERQLKIINKPPIKVIHTEYGYIVDCIDINKQPAFDHPLLKNHTLQRKPSFHVPTEETHDSPIFGLDKDECPTGTVPIRRTTKEDLIREKLLSHNTIMTQGIPGIHRAEVFLSSFNGPYYGVYGVNSIYNPRAAWNQESLSHIWVQKGDGSTTNKISAGWHVGPRFYGDDGTHLYASWTSDNYDKTGCFNVRCPGFVQVHLKGYLGSRLKQISGYDGPIYKFNSSITQDPKTNNWWLTIGKFALGYFPAALFSDMREAEQVGWGGRAYSASGPLSPQMGSGYFPDKTFRRASFFRMISYQDKSRTSFGPAYYQVKSVLDAPSCFGLVYYGNLGGKNGFCLQFGGPGGNCNN